MPGGTLTRLKQRLALLFATPAERRHARVGPAHLWEMKRAFQVEFLRRMGLERRQRLLDLGCGTLRGGLPLIEYLDAGHYTGIDVRAEVLDEARSELAEAGLAHKAPVLLHARALGELELATRFDVIWSFSVLIHLDDAALEQAFAFAARHLAPHGSFLGNVLLPGPSGPGSRGGSERQWQGFPVVTRSLDAYRAAGAHHDLGLRDLGSLAGLGHNSGDPEQDGQHMLIWRSATAASGAR
jgi:SAM-dependent methyltransferase